MILSIARSGFFAYCTPLIHFSSLERRCVHEWKLMKNTYWSSTKHKKQTTARFASSIFYIFSCTDTLIRTWRDWNTSCSQYVSVAFQMVTRWHFLNDYVVCWCHIAFTLCCLPFSMFQDVAECWLQFYVIVISPNNCWISLSILHINLSGVNQKLTIYYLAREWANYSKFHIFAFQHKANTYSERLFHSIDYVSLWCWSPLEYMTSHKTQE